MKLSNYAMGSFFNAEALEEEPFVGTVAKVSEEEVGPEKELKIVVEFDEAPTKLSLNKTNLRTLIGELGNESEDWIGKKVELYRDSTMMSGKKVACVRVRSL